MANEIYNSSWWGNGVCDNSIDWGVVYKDYAGCTPTFNTYSLAFDGVDDVLETPVLAPIETQLWTLSTWVKWNNLTGSNEAIFSTRQNGLASSTGFDLYITDSGGNLRARTYKGNGIGAQVIISTSTYGITTGVWYNIVCIYNSGTLSVSINDGAVFSGSASGNYTASGVNPTIGKWRNGSGYHDGNIDEVAIWGTDETANISTISTSPVVDLTSLSPIVWLRNGDNGTWKSPQWLIPNNENKTKFSNYSFEYDGVDDYVDVGAITQINSASALTFSFWGKKPISTNYLVVGSSITGTNGIWLSWWSDGNVYFSPRNGGYSNASFALAHDTNWHHFAGVYDGSIITADRCILYVDGVKVANSLSGVPTSLSATAGNNFQIGALLGAYFTSGNIDEIAVFSSALSGTDVTSIYNSGTPNDISSLSPVGYWRSEQSYFTDNWLVDNSALSNYSTRSFNFDGISDYVNCGANPLIGEGTLSISAWFNLSDANWNYILGDNSVQFKVKGSTGDTRISFYGSTDPFRAVVGTYVIGVWYNLTLTFDGSLAQADRLKLYLNGVSLSNVNTGTPSTTLLPNLSSPANFMIGRTGSYSGNTIYGNVDEVALWNTTLTPTNVTEIYNSGEPARIDGAVSHWRMGEDATFNTNWNVPDNVGSNTGTSVNMTIANLQGEAPNYTGGGLSNNMTIEDRIGDASNSSNNALSYNQVEADRETDVPT